MNIFFGGGGGRRGHHNIGLYLGAISMHCRVFFKVTVQNGEFRMYFWRGWGVLENPDIFFFFFFFFLGGGGER